MKQLFIEEYGQASFDHRFPSGSMKLVWMTDQWKLHTSNTIFHLFRDEIEAGKQSKSWFCIRIHCNVLSFHVKPSQAVIELIDEIDMSPTSNEETLSICETFDPDVSIPAMILVEAPEFRRIAMEVFSIPW